MLLANNQNNTMRQYSGELSCMANVQSKPQGQLLKGAECHIYLYCFTFVCIDLNRAFVIIIFFPKTYSSKQMCANGIGK